MLSNDIIEPSSSDWARPVVMEQKKNRKIRFYGDIRRINEATKKNAYPLPNMTAILDELRQAEQLTTLDLSQAYWQLPLAEESKEIAAFIIPGKGFFQFK